MQPHLAVKLSEKSHKRMFLRNGVGYGYLVAIRDLLGNCGIYMYMYIGVTGSTWRYVEGKYNDAHTHLYKDAQGACIIITPALAPAT